MCQPSTITRHAAWKRALYPIALRIVEDGEFPPAMNVTNEAQAWGIAHIAASDMVSRGRTRMLPMDEVLAANPFTEATEAPVSAGGPPHWQAVAFEAPAKIPTLKPITEKVRQLDPALWGLEKVG
jgi:hypothetical protein